MLDFLPPDEMTLGEAGEKLMQALPLADGGTRECDRSYYDTFDGLLHHEEIYCVHEDGRLALVDRASGREMAAIASAVPTHPLQVVELEDGAFRETLGRVIGVRALLPLVHVHSRVRSFGVLGGERKTVVRMTVEEPFVVSASGIHRPLRPRARVAAVRGYDDKLSWLSQRLRDDLGFRSADQPLVDEAVRAVGLAPGGISAKPDVPLDPGERTDRAAAKVLGRLLEVILANLDGTIADLDTEFLHDLRVAVRRSRSVQRELKRAFPPQRLGDFRADFRWLQQVTGDSRDLDVYVLEFEDYRAMVPASMRPDLDPLLGVLRSRRLDARRTMVRALRSERTQRLLGDWGEFLGTLESLPVSDRPDAQRPIRDVAGERISKVYRRMLKIGRAIDESSPASDYHELRKKGKELRYLLELFGMPLFDSGVVKPMIKTLKGLQDVLGRHQDREVQIVTLRSLRDEVASMPGGPPALMAMGVLVDRLGADAGRTRTEFAAAFATFSSKSQRALVKETFG